MNAFPNAADLQSKVARIKYTLLDELAHREAQQLQEVINLLEVVKRIDTYTTIPMESPSPALPNFPYDHMGCPFGL